MAYKESKEMRKVVLVDDVEYEKVDWGLTKNLVGPQNIESKRLKLNITEYLQVMFTSSTRTLARKKLFMSFPVKVSRRQKRTEGKLDQALWSLSPQGLSMPH